MMRIITLCAFILAGCVCVVVDPSADLMSLSVLPTVLSAVPFLIAFGEALCIMPLRLSAVSLRRCSFLSVSKPLRIPRLIAIAYWCAFAFFSGALFVAINLIPSCGRLFLSRPVWRDSSMSILLTGLYHET